VGKGVLREGIDVRVADESSMRPVMGTAGPSHQLSRWWYVQCHAVVSCILKQWEVVGRVDVLCEGYPC